MLQTAFRSECNTRRVDLDRQLLMGLVEQQQHKEQAEEERREEEGRRYYQRRRQGDEKEARSEPNAGNRYTIDKHPGDSRVGEDFFCDLRRLLLRMRIAGQLGQDFVLDTHLVELKALCREVCTKLGTTAGVMQELSAAVAGRRETKAAERPTSTLKQDAETVSRARKILREATTAATSGTTSSMMIGTENRQGISARRKLNGKTGGGGTGTRDRGGGGQPSPLTNLQRIRSSALPAPPAPLLRCFANPLGVTSTANACLSSVFTEDEERPGSLTKPLVAAREPAPAPVPVRAYRAHIARGPAAMARRRRRGREAAPRRESASPSSLSSSPQSLSSSSSSTVSSSSVSPLQTVQCNPNRFVRPRRASIGRRGGGRVIEGSAQGSDDEGEGDREIRNGTPRSPGGPADNGHQGSWSTSQESIREEVVDRAESPESQRGSAGDYGTASSDDNSTEKRTGRPGVRLGIDASRGKYQCRRVPRRVSWKAPSAASSPPPTSVSPQTPQTPPRPPVQPPPPPPPPPPPAWPRASCLEPEVAFTDEEIPQGRARFRDRRYCPDRHRTHFGEETVENACHEKAVRESAGGSPPERRYGRGRRRNRRGEGLHYRGGEPEREGEQHGDCAGAHDDTRLKCELSVEDLETQPTIPRRLRCKARGGGECGGSGGDAEGRRCPCSCRKDEDDDFRDEEEEIPGHLREPEPVTRGGKSARRRRHRGTSLERARNVHSGDVHPQRDGGKIGSKASFSWCRSPLSADPLNEDSYDSNGRGRSAEEGARQVVRSGRHRSPTLLPERTSDPRSGNFDSPVTCWEEEEREEEEGEEEERNSCTLARKRALLRVRLARQRRELANAVVDAKERGLRAERRRRREEKLAALLMKAQVDEIRIDSSNTVGCRAVRFRDESDGNQGSNRPARARLEETRPRTGAGGVYSMALPRNEEGNDDGDNDDDDDDDEDEDEVPRQPLRVAPVAAATCGVRSTYRRTNHENRKGEGREQDPPARPDLGGNVSSDDESDRAAFNLSRSCVPCSPSTLSVAVRIDTLHVFGDERSRAAGFALYLVLDAGGSRRRTATRQRRPEARGAVDGCGRSGASGASERQPCTLGMAAVSGGVTCGSNDIPAHCAGAWVFNETVSLCVAMPGGRGRGREGTDGDENVGDDVLRIRVYAERRRSSGGPRCSASGPCARRASRKIAPACQGRDEPRTDAAPAQAVASPGEIIGSATIALRRYLAMAGSDVGNSAGRRPWGDPCTYSRTREALVLSPEGEPIGCIGFGVCSMEADASRD